MSHVDQGPLSHYNSLSDNHLSGFFNNPRMRKHLRKSGLINKDGYIVSEKMYRLNMCRKEQKKHVKDMIAQAIVHKTLDLERTRQAEIRKKLEEIAKIELVRNIKMSRQRKRDVEVLPFINSRSGSRQRSHSNPANGQSKRRSVSAPSKKAKRPVSELSSNYDDDDEDLVVYLDDEGRPIPKSHFNEPEGRLSKKDVIDTRNLYSLNPTALRKYALMMAKMEQSKNGPDSPYLEPQVPLPPKSPRSGRMPRSARRYMSITDKQKQSSPQRPSTAAHRQTGGSPQRLRVQQVPRCQITMCYLGSQLNLAREQFDKQQEVIIEQQHCGGNTLTVFKGRLEPGEEFNFTSYRHCGYPFALTMYIDGKTDSRISTCCEYRHRKGCRVFGKNGHFSLVEISADASPCYKCQVEHGLKDKNNSKGSKPKKNQQPVEDQEEVVIPEQKKEETPREEEEDDLIDGPPKRHLEVPVEDDDPKGNGKYDDDDFESSSSDSGSESSSSNDSSRSSKRSTKSQSSNSESDKDNKKKRDKGKQTGAQHKVIAVQDKKSSDSSDNEDNRKKADKGKHKETKQSVVPVKGKMDSDSSDEEYSVKKVKEKSFQSRGQESIVTEVKDSDIEDERKVSFTVKTTEKKSYESTLLMETSKSTVTGKKMELQDSPRSQGSVSSSSSSSSSSGSVRRRSTQPVSSPKRAETTHHQADKPKIVPQPPTSPPPGDTMKVRKSPEPRKAEPVQSPAVQRTPAPEVDSDKDPQPARKESISSVSSSTSSSSSSSSGNSSSRSSSDSENEALNQNSQGSGVIPAINLQAPVERSGEPISKKETHSESSLEPMRKKEHHVEGSLEGSLEPFSKKETHLERSVEPVSKKEAPVETHKDPVSQKEIEKVEVTMAHGDVATVGDENILDLVPKRRDSETSVRSSSSSSSASSSSSSSSSGSLNIPENTPRQEQGTDLTEAKREPLDDKGIGTFEKEPQLLIEEDNSLFLEEENALLEVEEKALFGDDEETQIVRQDENSEVSEHDEAENVPIIAPLRPPPAPITMPGPITVDFVKEKGEDKSDSGSGSESDSDSGSSSSSSSISGHSSDSGRSSKSDSGNKEGKAPVISTESVIETTADIHKFQSETVDTKQDPDVVVDADVAKGNFEEGVSKMSHSSPDPIAAPEPPEPRAGSILPELQKAQQIVDIKGVLLTKSQIDESVLFLLNKQAMDQMHFVNCGLHDKDLHVLGTAVRKSPANPVVLNFSFNPLTVNCVDDLLALAKDKPSIEAILLQGTHLGDEGIQKLVDGLLKQHREKYNKDGDVAEATITSSDSVDFDNVKELHELDLTKSGIGDKGVKALCTLIRSDMAIDTLNLSLNKEITLEGWKELAQAIQKTRHLETLTLDHNHIGNEGIEELTKGLFENTSILALDLNNIGITDQGGKFIIELLKRNTSILEINLAGNKISNQLLEDISKYTALNKSVE